MRTVSMCVTGVLLLLCMMFANPVTGQTQITKLFFSEYIEGSSNNKALEIYNGSGAAVDLSGYVVELYSNGRTTPGKTIALSTIKSSLADGEVLVIANASANAAILANADITSSITFFNGDDALVLKNNGAIVDTIGVVGTDPGALWGSGGIKTQNATLRRLPSVCGGDADGFNNPTDISDQWSGFPQDTFDGLGSHAADCGGAPSDTDGDGVADAQDNCPFVSNAGQEDTDLDGVGDVCDNCPENSNPAQEDSNHNGVGDLCEAAPVFTKIHEIQGNGDVSPLLGSTQTIEGIVIADFQEDHQLRGFYVQEEDGDVDSNPATSEGIFVYNSSISVNVGDLVQVTGIVGEYKWATQLSAVSEIKVVDSGLPLPPAVTLDLPLPEDTSLEAYEGMRASFPEALTVSQNYFQGRYGQVTLSAEGRLYQPTNLFLPGSAEAIALKDENQRRMIVLDDGSTKQNPNPIPYIGADNTLRSGDMVTGLTGAISYGPITNRSDGPQHYLLHPTEEVQFTRVNERTAAPAPVWGELKVASFNVLNYFNGDGLGGGFPTSRGANTPEEFTRQREKIITAIAAIDADVIGLMEIENDESGNSAIEDLVSGLNDAAGSGVYSFINTGKIGMDEIRVALLYKPGTVSPAGSFALLDSSVDASFNTEKNRPALAQTFAQNSTGEKFTVVVNHLKSKGSSCADLGDPEDPNGQGNCNITRTNAATALVNWLAADPTGSNDTDFLIVGDLNAYAMEDPITALRQAGYVNLLERFGGPQAYSYIFDGQAGYLDHALASPSLVAQVSGANDWHINADEPSVLDYNTEYKSQDLYTVSPYRASDHDPVIIGLQLRSNFEAANTADTLSVSAGDIFTYTIDIENPFQQTLYFHVADALNENLIYVSGDLFENDGVLNYTELLGSGESLSVAFEVQVLPETLTNTLIENVAVITAYLDPANIAGTTVAIVEAISQSVEVVPEPSTLILFGSGVLGVVALLRKKRKVTQ